MTPRNEIAASRLAARIQARNGETVAISSGVHSVSLTAVVGKTENDIETSDGIVTESNTIDFIVTAAELILNGTVTRPTRGMRITRELNGKVYSVHAMGNEQPWRWCDHSEILMRIHTIQVSA